MMNKAVIQRFSRISEQKKVRSKNIITSPSVLTVICAQFEAYEIIIGYGIIIAKRISSEVFLFNLENIYFFPSCSGGSDFTRSLHHIRKPEGSLHTKKPQGMVYGKFEFNSYGRLRWKLPELHFSPKRYHLKRNRFDYQLFKRGSHGHLQTQLG